MQAEIMLTDGGEPIDLIDLHAWLVRSPAVTANARIQIIATGRNDGMSAGDAIQLVSTGVTVLTSVVSAYAAWRSSRSSAPAIVIVVDGGKSVVVRHGETTEIAALLEGGGQTQPKEGDPQTGEALEGGR